MTASERLADWSRVVRESTLKRLLSVPAGWENWQPISGMMSVADFAKHLIDADVWLFRKLDDHSLEPITGCPAVTQIHERSDYDNLINELEDSGQSRAELIGSLAENELDTLIPDKRFGGEVSIWWVIVRGNLDHEIHHRGQIATYLALMESG
jgi:uncharacterized damage-inducible protein DinB